MIWQAETVFAPAKINLFLSILDKRLDGYHHLLSWMCPLALADRIQIKPVEGQGQIELAVFSPDFPDLALGSVEENLVVKAYRAYQAVRSDIPALSVSLEKRIPVQAGLGGGSSDAAAMLIYLNQYSPEPLSEMALFELATGLGADVPFFLLKASAKAEGIGERLTRLPSLPAWPVLLLKPRQWGLSTKEAFNALSGSKHELQAWPRQLDELESGKSLSPFSLLSIEEVYACQHNDFEAPLRWEKPQLEAAFAQLEVLGLHPVLSGSGPTVVCILPEAPSSALTSELSKAFPLNTWWMAWTNLA